MRELTAEKAIEEMVHRETLAWNTKDVHLLLSLFHPDMVWPWPPTAKDHDPETWSVGFGRYNYEIWSQEWQSLFSEHELVHNERKIIVVKVSAQKDGGFAVVDIDTLWKHKETGEMSHWKGRTCKGYTKLSTGEWKFIMQTGVLDYPLN